MAENYRSRTPPPVQCSTEGDEPLTFQTAREVPPSSSDNAAARPGDGAGNASTADLDTDAVRYTDGGRPAPTGDNIPTGATPLQPPPQRDVITLTCGDGKSKIVAEGLASVLVQKPGTNFVVGSNITMNQYQTNSRPSRTDNSSQGSSTSQRQATRPLTKNKERPQFKHMDPVSRGIGQDWRRLGRALDIEDSILTHISMDYYAQGQSEVNYQMLIKWTQAAVQSTVTVECLALALESIGRGDLADELS